MLIAIDHGNYAIKTPHHSFVSGLSEHTVKPPMADEILEYDGRYWTTSGKRLSYMRDKTQDERYFILTLFAIAKELEDTGRYSPVEQIQLAVGLPPEHYGVLKDKFARYFKRDGIIRFVYKDKPYSIMIDKVMVFPQAYAAVVPKSSMVVNMLRVFVVDIGGYTTDVLLLKNGKPDLQFCRSLETGIITMNNEIIRKVGALHDMRIEDEHISAVLSGQDTILPDDVKQTICGATKLHAQDILNQLRELQVISVPIRLCSSVAEVCFSDRFWRLLRWSQRRILWSPPMPMRLGTKCLAECSCPIVLHKGRCDRR